MDLSLEAVIVKLNDPTSLKSDQDAPPKEGFRDAAVIAPLVMRAGELHLIFNKRAEGLDNHPGQVSFPGGRRDPEDPHLLFTAQRELAEELAIEPDQHRPLKRLAARKVISHYTVTPFISLIDPDATIIPEPGEVAYHFEVPLAHLATPGVEVARTANVFGKSHTFYAFDHGKETIWGATGRMVADLLIALGATHFKK